MVSLDEGRWAKGESRGSEGFSYGFKLMITKGLSREYGFDMVLKNKTIFVSR
jgi:hypothetical protein